MAEQIAPKAAENINFSAFLNYSKLGKLILRDLQETNPMSKQVSKYTKEKIAEYLANPAKNEKELREACTYIYNASSHFRRLINYFAKMPTYAYVIMPYKLDTQKVNDKTFRSSYRKALDLLEVMNLKHEFIKVLTTAFREDVYFGYEYSTSDSFFIQTLDAQYCKLSSIEDGCYCFAFDFSFFKGKESLLTMYAPEFTTKFNVYKGDSKQRWQELDPKRTICIKIQEDLPYCVPPFSGVLPEIYDIEDYKGLMKAKTETGNYKMLALQIPVEDGEIKMDLELAKSFYRALGQELPENIGAVLTPMKIESFDFEKSGSTQDLDAVHRAESQFWSSAGTSSYLFAGGDNPSSSTLSISINTDAEIIYAVLRQLERWVNRKLKSLPGAFKFKVHFLDMTVYNAEKVANSLLKAAQSSLPTKMAAAAAIGMSPADFDAMSYLENTMLKLHENLVPLSTSYTQSGANDPGRPTNESKGEDLSDSGEQTQENDSNETE